MTNSELRQALSDYGIAPGNPLTWEQAYLLLNLTSRALLQLGATGPLLLALVGTHGRAAAVESKGRRAGRTAYSDRLEECVADLFKAM